MTDYSPIWRDADAEFEDDDLELDLDSDWDELPPPRPQLRLSPAQQNSLFAAVEAGLQAQGCDNTLRAAEGWAQGEGLRWSRLREQLEGNGGYCDCEILLNIAPSEEPDGHPPG